MLLQFSHKTQLYAPFHVFPTFANRENHPNLATIFTNVTISHTNIARFSQICTTPLPKITKLFTFLHIFTSFSQIYDDIWCFFKLLRKYTTFSRYFQQTLQIYANSRGFWWFFTWFSQLYGGFACFSHILRNYTGFCTIFTSFANIRTISRFFARNIHDFANYTR